MRRARSVRAGRANEALGLGWILTTTACGQSIVDVCRHGGKGPGFSAEMMLAPEAGLAMAVILNVDADAQGIVARSSDTSDCCWAQARVRRESEHLERTQSDRHVAGAVGHLRAEHPVTDR